jgi:hypothetical protein
MELISSREGNWRGVYMIKAESGSERHETAEVNLVQGERRLELVYVMVSRTHND